MQLLFPPTRLTTCDASRQTRKTETVEAALHGRLKAAACSLCISVYLLLLLNDYNASTQRRRGETNPAHNAMSRHVFV